MRLLALLVLAAAATADTVVLRDGTVLSGSVTTLAAGNDLGNNDLLPSSPNRTTTYPSEDQATLDTKFSWHWLAAGRLVLGHPFAALIATSDRYRIFP